jgi:uncharacterized small protein (DUF1192 family)
MVNAESTKEQVETYLDALAREREGYEVRIGNAKSGHQERLEVGELENRVKAVDAEVKRAKGLLGKKDKPEAAAAGGAKGKGKGKGEEPAAEPAKDEVPAA